MKNSLDVHLQKIDETLGAVLKDMEQPYSGKPPELVFAKPQFPQPGWETDWQSCTSEAAPAGVSHFVGCVIDGPNAGEAPDAMINRCNREAELVSLAGQVRCWIGKKAGGGVFQ